MIAAGSMGFLVLGYLKSWFAILPLGFAVLGMVALQGGRKEAARVLGAFRHGRCVRGEVESVQLDSPYEVKGRRPWRIVYSFKTSKGSRRTGTAVTFDSTAPNRQKGQPLWVLVVDEHPEQNTIYPPVK